MLRILTCSDWHADWSTRGVDRFDDVARAVEQTVKEAVDRKVDLYAMTGDLCDPDSGSSVFRCVALALDAARELRSRGIMSFWVAGNHDVIEDGRGRTTLEPLCSLGSCAGLTGVFEKAESFVWRSTRFLTLPYTARSCAYDPAAAAAAAVKESSELPLVVLGHLHVPGVIPGEETAEMPRGREVLFPVEQLRGKARLMINGHYHRRQTTPDGIEIPGSLVRLTFAEEGNDPGFIVSEVA